MRQLTRPLAAIVAATCLALLLICPSPAPAAGTDTGPSLKITFAWTPNPESDQVAGYTIYESNVSGDTTNAEQWHPINAEPIAAPPYGYVISEPVREDRWWYIVAEDAAGLKSQPSNTVTYFVNTIPPGTVQGLEITGHSITLDFSN